jgi:Uma2 family endonuclease
MESLHDTRNATLKQSPIKMLSPSNLSARDFAELKYSLPEAGRWHELHDGQTVVLSAPDDVHGTIVLNLSRALAEWFKNQPPPTRGYACHDLGLHVQSEPDTVYVPAMSIFREGKPFGQSDNIIATEIPRIVIDVASSNDRRCDMRLRTTAYMKLGVECIWVPDPFKKEVQIIRRSGHTSSLGKWQTLDVGDLLPGFTMSVESVFVQPKWWNATLPDSPEPG